MRLVLVCAGNMLKVYVLLKLHVDDMVTSCTYALILIACACMLLDYTSTFNFRLK
jgi:hypothetical protein